MNDKNTITKAVLFVLIPVLLSSCFDAGGDDFRNAEPPVFQDVTVHDPSIMNADGMFYIVGSHLQSAKSEDLLGWEQMSSSLTRASSVMPNAAIQLQEALTWAESDTLWAGDWIYLEGTGKYHMYYCACEGSSPRSAMGMAVADSPSGPYVNQEVFLKSGMWGEESPDGTVYDANIHPNAIDPHVFYDKEGILWMVYGSYSGGIFILELDIETGLPIDGQGYGKHLLGGRHSKVEAPYIQYNPGNSFYYLFTSFGGLDSKGGYQIRVARSKNPDGPYEDISGQQMESLSGDLTTIKRYGQKLFGNYEWNDSSDELARGYVSPGHNSTYYDEQKDKFFLIFHTRFPEQGELHQVRVHEMFFTEEGWPVIAPFRYAGDEVESLGDFTSKQVTGIYQFINHGKEIGSAITRPFDIELENDGKISGEQDGSWELTNGNRITLQIGNNEWNGYVVRQWIESRNEYGFCFTAVAEDGTSVWGLKEAS